MEEVLVVSWKTGEFITNSFQMDIRVSLVFQIYIIIFDVGLDFLLRINNVNS